MPSAWFRVPGPAVRGRTTAPAAGLTRTPARRAGDSRLAGGGRAVPAGGGRVVLAGVAGGARVENDGTRIGGVPGGSADVVGAHLMYRTFSLSAARAASLRSL